MTKSKGSRSQKKDGKKAVRMNSQKQQKQQQQPRGIMNKTIPMVFAPTAIGSEQRFAARRKRSHRFQGSENISDIFGSTGLDVSRFLVNPGIAATFPRLSVEAEKWDQYTFHGLQFRFVPLTTSTKEGSVTLSPDYNVRDAEPSSDREASNTMDAVQVCAWEPCTSRLDRPSMHANGPRKYLRSANVFGDLLNYDVAQFFVVTAGQDNSNKIGNLWADYDVELFVPQDSPADGTVPSGISRFQQTNVQSLSDATWTDVTWDTLVCDPLGCAPSVAGVFTPAPGSYHVTGLVYMTGTAPGGTTFLMRGLFNGGSLFPLAAVTNETASDNPAVTMPIDYLIDCDGTDTFAVQVYADSSAGVTEIGAGGAVLSFSVV